jgi:3,4-dihydroxy 2-butanone 4-phosphate synthase/GTP cyclohydrolase II
MNFASIPELLEELRQGRMIILIDDEDRENEGDLVLPAQFATADHINFMAKEARGLICLALEGEQVDRLGLKPMVDHETNRTPNKTAFTVSIEAAQGVTTGISAADRAHTIRVASHPLARPEDVRSPGHVFPLRAQKGGVLRRAGHTEGSVDLMRLAGLWPAAVICEIMNTDGSMARVPDLLEFAACHRLKVGTIADLIAYRLRFETLVHEVPLSKDIQRSYGSWRLRVFESVVDDWQHLVLQKGSISSSQAPLVRILREDGVKELLDAVSNNATAIQVTLNKLAKQESALFVYLRGPSVPCPFSGWNGLVKGRGVMDSREYGLGAQILKACGVGPFRLLTNHPEKRVGLEAFGLEIVEFVPLKSLSPIA